MWGIIIESGIIALVFGFVTSISGIIITNVYSKKKEQQEKRYLLTKEIYQKLVSIYNKQISNDNINIDNIDNDSIPDIFTNATITMHEKSIEKAKELEKSFLEVRYLLKIDVDKSLELKFNEIESIKKALFYSAFNDRISKKEGYDDIIKNDEIEIIDVSEIGEYTKKYIDEVSALESYFIKALENELRRLLE